jgi:hypothetical protein
MGSGRVWRCSVQTDVALVPCRVGALLYCFLCSRRRETVG